MISFVEKAFGRGPRTRFGHCRLRRGAQNALGRGRSGKRGGLRIIYFLRTRHGQIWMLTLYAKNVAENIPAHVLRQIKDEIDG